MQQKLRRSQLKHPGIIICERRCGALFPSLPVWRNRNPVRWHSRSDPIGCRARRLCVAILVPSPPSPLSRTLPQGSLRDRMRCHNGNSISQVFFAVPTIVRDVFPNASQASSLPHPAQLIKDYFRHMLQPRVFFSLGGGVVRPANTIFTASSSKWNLSPQKLGPAHAKPGWTQIKLTTGVFGDLGAFASKSWQEIPNPALFLKPQGDGPPTTVLQLARGPA